jgi:ABC-type branched-subunit amino acid transport system substrate-binding protein
MSGRRSISLACTSIALGVFVAALGAEVAQRPHFDTATHQVTYAGPGRTDPPPNDPSEVLIGYFGPSDPDHPKGGDLWLASSLAVEEANRAGGYRGLPFRLVPAWSENAWGTGVAQLARMVYADGVWAIIGSIDGTSTHLAEQVVAKARLTLIGPAGTDNTVNLANVAWMFSCLPADDRQAAVLARALSETVERGPLLLSATDHDARVATAELKKALDLEGIAPLHHVELESGAAELTELADWVVSTGAESVVILAGPVDSARLVTALRTKDPDLQLYGGSSMSRRVFLERAGAAADGVLFPLPCDSTLFTDGFSRDFESRFGRRPDCTAAQTYDATRLLIAAIRQAGLNRTRIRDAVQALSPWSGAAGTIEWNALGQNQREVHLATIALGTLSFSAPK